MAYKTPKYPNLTKKGFLSQRGHDLSKTLINDILNPIIAELPYGLPVTEAQRAMYAADIYRSRCEGFEGYQLQTPLNFNDREIREMLYECTNQGPLRLITRPNPKGADEMPLMYLERYPIFETPELLGYIHHFRMSDDPHIHNHPWRIALSTILAGEYTEVSPKDLSAMELNHNLRPTGSVGILSFDEFHRVKLPQTSTGERSVWTFFVHHRNWEQGWNFIEEEGVDHQVWDDLINNNEGGYKQVKAYPLVPKEVGASPKDWWTNPGTGETGFIGPANILRERFGLTKESYL